MQASTPQPGIGTYKSGQTTEGACTVPIMTRRAFVCPRRTGRLALRAVLALAIVLVRPPALAQEPMGPPGGHRRLTVEDREFIVMPAHASAASEPPSLVRAAAGAFPEPIAVEVRETISHRIHVVSIDGQTWRASAPLHGPRSWVVFDPARRRFESLLPSIRVELGGGTTPQAVALSVGATGIEVFDSLGFAIVILPGDLHPADALARLRSLPGEPEATARLRRPRINWR